MENERELGRVSRFLDYQENLNEIANLFPYGGNLAVDLVIFAGQNQFKDLFGETWFSLSEFCEKMGYDRTTLQKKLTEKQLTELFKGGKPIYKEVAGTGEEHCHEIENVFEAALYILGSNNLRFRANMPDGATQYFFLQVVESFKINMNFTSAKKTKRLYHVQLSNKFLDTLLNAYNLMMLNDYKLLPNKTGYRSFYLQLCRMIMLIKFKIQQNQTPVYVLKVDELAMIFDIDVKNNNDRKKRVTEILNAINDRLNIAKFEYAFFKEKGDRWAYRVKFTFSAETLSFFDEKYKASFTSKFYAEMCNLYFELNDIPKPKWYKEQQLLKESPKDREKFRDWLYSEKNIEDKKKRYNDVFLAIFGKDARDYNLEFNFNFKLDDIA